MKNIIKLNEKIKVNISILINRTIKGLHMFDQKWTQLSYNPNPNNYKDLAPISDAEKNKNYSEALLWAIKNQNVKNVALTGPYGSGKSSILKTFENEHKQFKYLNISLAAFNVSGKNAEEKNNLIEQSILQQLFYHVKNKTIPDSRFKKIPKTKPWNYSLKAIAYVTWLLCLFLLIYPTFISRIIWWEIYSNWIQANFNFIILLIFISGCVYLTYKALKTVRLTKLKASDAEIELGPKNESTVFNKYLDEIVYFFDVTQFDVVVIEDLDRFNNTDIFISLRELNALLNNSLQINRPITFVYAIKDDLFQKEKNDRTKFFDFIIPIIPIVNFSNAEEKFKELLKDCQLNDKIDDGFISPISFYIDDMRLIINIVNEFNIYSKEFSRELKRNSLLAIIVYKNCYPNDFAALHNNEGILFTIFNKKEDYLKKLIEVHKEEIQKMEDEIIKLEALNLKSLYELNALYLARIIENKPSQSTLNIDNNPQLYSTLLNGSIFEKLNEKSRFKYFDNGWHEINTFQNIEKEVDPNNSYKEKKMQLERKNNNEIESLRGEITQCRAKVNDIELLTMKEIFEQPSFSLLELVSEDLTKYKLLIYLIRHGYIDETYINYISHFYEGSLSFNDRNFMLSVSNEEAKSSNYKLDNTAIILEKLHISDFKKPSILNINLLDTLLSKHQKYHRATDLFIEQLSDEKDTSLKFIQEYIDAGVLKSLLIKNLVRKWKNLWVYISDKFNYPVEKIDDLFKIILVQNKATEIATLNVNLSLSKYLSSKENIGGILNQRPNNDNLTLKNIITELQIKFSNIKDLDQYPDLKDHIYQNSCFEINEHMIEVMLKQSDFNDEQLKTQNYTCIRKSGLTHLIDYIEENIKDYIIKVFLQIISNFDEEEIYIIDLLNNESLSEDEKQFIIVKQKNKIGNLRFIKEVKAILLTTNRIIPNWENVIDYYLSAKKIDDFLVAFLNRDENYKPLLEKNIDKQILEDDNATVFFKELIETDSIDNYVYEMFTKVYPYSIEDGVKIEGLSKAKVIYLINEKMLPVSTHYFNLIKTHFTDLKIKLIENDINEVLNKISDFDLSADDYTLLLQSTKIEETQKADLIIKIPNNTFNGQNEIKSQVFSFLSNNPSLIFNLNLLPHIYNLIPGDTAKINFLSEVISKVSVTELDNLLREFGSIFSELLDEEEEISIANNETNLELLKTLKGKKIKSWIIDGEFIKIKK